MPSGLELLQVTMFCFQANPFAADDSSVNKNSTDLLDIKPTMSKAVSLVSGEGGGRGGGWSGVGGGGRERRADYLTSLFSLFTPRTTCKWMTYLTWSSPRKSI